MALASHSKSISIYDIKGKGGVSQKELVVNEVLFLYQFLGGCYSRTKSDIYQASRKHFVTRWTFLS